MTRSTVADAVRGLGLKPALMHTILRILHVLCLNTDGKIQPRAGILQGAASAPHAFALALHSVLRRIRT